MTAAIRIGDLVACDVSRIHALVWDDDGQTLFRGSATVIALDAPNGVLIAKTGDDREVRVPVEVETRPNGGDR